MSERAKEVIRVPSDISSKPITSEEQDDQGKKKSG